MTEKNSHSAFVARRAELLAELFLQGLDPVFLSRPTSAELGYDFLVGFANSQGGTNTFAVLVRATERPASSRFTVPRESFNRLTRSNIPGLLLVVDAKHNQLFYAILGPGSRARASSNPVPVPLAEVNAATTSELRKILCAAPTSAAAAAAAG
jgi:hypothetical protein